MGRVFVEITSLILWEPRGATLCVLCWNLPSLYIEPRTDYYSFRAAFKEAMRKMGVRHDKSRAYNSGSNG